MKLLDCVEQKESDFEPHHKHIRSKHDKMIFEIVSGYHKGKGMSFDKMSTSTSTAKK